MRGQISDKVWDQALAVDTTRTDEQLLFTLSLLQAIEQVLLSGGWQEANDTLDELMAALAEAQAALGRVQAAVATTPGPYAAELRDDALNAQNQLTDAALAVEDVRAAVEVADTPAALAAMPLAQNKVQEAREILQAVEGLVEAGWVSGLRLESSSHLGTIDELPLVTLRAAAGPAIFARPGREQILVRHRSEAEVAWNAALALRLAVEAARLAVVEAAPRARAYRPLIGIRL